MLTERERHGMAELLGRMDPADLISLAQVTELRGQKLKLVWLFGEALTINEDETFTTNLPDSDLPSVGSRYSCRSS